MTIVNTSNLKELILNADDISEILSIHPVTVRRLAKQGKIPARKIGKEWRFNRDIIMQWLGGDTPNQVNTFNTSDDERAQTSWQSGKAKSLIVGKSAILSVGKKPKSITTNSKTRHGDKSHLGRNRHLLG